MKNVVNMTPYDAAAAAADAAAKQTMPLTMPPAPLSVYIVDCCDSLPTQAMSPIPQTTATTKLHSSMDDESIGTIDTDTLSSEDSLMGYY